MSVPPGILFLARLAVQGVPSSIVAYLGLGYLIKRFDLQVSTPVIILIASLTRPLYALALTYWIRNANWADSRRRGAVLVPQVRDPWPGGLGIIAAMVKNFKIGYPGDVFLDWCELYGNTYSLNIASEQRIITFEPEHIKAILATQFDVFDKGPVLYDQFFSLLGTGVFNSDGDMWKFHRTITRPFFSKDRISHFDIFGRHAEDALAQAKNRLAVGYSIDFQDLVSRFTLDSATEFLFGHDVGSLSAGLPYPSSSDSQSSLTIGAGGNIEHSSDRFVRAFMAGQIFTGLRTRYGPNWPLAEFWKEKVGSHRKVIDEFVEPIIEEALRKKGNIESEGGAAEGKEEEDQTLLDHLVSQTQDRKILKDELTNLLVAGRDTTASTLTFGLYMLTQHPNIVKRLRDEISSAVRGDRPTYDEIKDMKYLRAFINETLRLYPPVPFNSRASNKATVWPSTTSGVPSFYIPAHTRCGYGVFLMHRRTDLWGPDALEFDPDRFLDYRLQKYFIPNPQIFLPFNAGPRICLGQQFAYNETSFFLIRLLQNFSHFSLEQPIEARPPEEWKAFGGLKGTEKVWPGTHLTMYVKGGLWVKMSPMEEFNESNVTKINE